MHVEDPDLRPCDDHDVVLADRYHLGPVLRRSPGCCSHRGFDDLLQRTVGVTLVAASTPFALHPRSWADRGPEVAELYDAGDIDGRLFLVTEHPAEATLAETTPPGGLDVAEVRALGAAVAGTLAPRHRQGAAHGGLGAGTVAWSPRGASLAEFGLLPWLERSGDLPVTAPFPAPEYDTGAPGDPASDVYALGRLLDELAPDRRRRGLRDLLAEMTAADPADRPTMDEVARRLGPRRTGPALARPAAVVATACCLVGLGIGLSAAAGSVPSAPGATLSSTAAAPAEPARAAPFPVAPFPVAPPAAETVVAEAPEPVPTTRATGSPAPRAATWRSDDAGTTEDPTPTPTRTAGPTARPTSSSPTRSTAPDETPVDETPVDATAPDETTVDETAPDETAAAGTTRDGGTDRPTTSATTDREHQGDSGSDRTTRTSPRPQDLVDDLEQVTSVLGHHRSPGDASRDQ